MQLKSASVCGQALPQAAARPAVMIAMDGRQCFALSSQCSVVAPGGRARQDDRQLL